MHDRSNIAALIQALQEACRRPLFTEICVDLEAITSSHNGAGATTRATAIEHAGMDPKNKDESDFNTKTTPVPDSSQSNRDAVSETDSQDAFLTTARKSSEEASLRTWREVSAALPVVILLASLSLLSPLLCTQRCFSLALCTSYYCQHQVAFEGRVPTSSLHDRKGTRARLAARLHPPAGLLLATFNWERILFVTKYTRTSANTK